MFVKPAANPNFNDAAHPTNALETLRVWDPALKNFLPPEGRNVGDGNRFYWARELNTGAVTLMDPATAEAAIAAGEAKRNAEIAARQDAAKPAKEKPAATKSGGSKSSTASTSEGA